MEKRNNSKCVILVTGANGFLGQHVIAALSKYADHVTEIRVLDQIRYENNTVTPIRKDVKHYVGDILDTTLLSQACKGVDCVIHLAAVVDLNVIPNVTKSFQVNVEGTRLLLEACKNAGVKRFLYCSTVGVLAGFDSVNNGTEDLTIPKEFNSTAYGGSKSEAEKLVLEANCDDFKTLALRPGLMYGEYNPYMQKRLRKGWIQNTYIPELYDATKYDWVYVGNVAWAFIKAEQCLLDGTRDVAGQAFLIGDETLKIPNLKHYSVLEICFENAGLKPVMPLAAFRPMLFCIKLLLYIVYFINKYIFRSKAAYDGWKLQPFRNHSVLTVYTKAKRLLDYKPLFSYEEAKNLTTAYIRSLL